MRYLVAFNVLDRGTGRPTALKVSCEFKDLPRAAAVLAMRRYASEQGILIGGVPSSVKSVSPRPRGRLPPAFGDRPTKAAKVRLPSL